jgi:serine/threonine protein kinase
MLSTSVLFAGRFRLGPLLGQGGMSDVYRAVDEQTGQPVALKIVRSGDPDLARRITQEVKVHQRMVHPGLIRLLDTGVADGQAYLVMELVEGVTLAASLRAEPLGARLTAKLGGLLGDALAYVHAEGIVHRDVKPSNIMLGADGRALLGDFGIARLLDSTAFTIDGTTLGTIAYMAPEQLENHQVGPPADIWSLGIVLLECLTGQRVYDGTSSEIIARRLAGPVPLPADLPVPWKLLLSGMLDHRPDQRLDGAGVSALLAAPVYAIPWTAAPAQTERVGAVPLDLRALASGQPHTATLAPAEPAPPTRTTRRGVWAVGLLALLALVAGVTYALAHKPASPPPLAHQTSTTSTTPPTTSTSTTSTTIPTAPSALAGLVQDVTSGVDAGTVNPGLGQQLTALAQQAVTDEAGGNAQQAADDLQQAATLIATGEQNNGIASSEAPVLQGDLSTLASTLGLPAASTPETTTTTTTIAPTPVGPPTGLGHHHHP